MKISLAIVLLTAMTFSVGAGPVFGQEQYIKAKCFNCQKLYRVPIKEEESVIVTCPHCGEKAKIKMPEPKVIPWEKARKYIGKEKTIEGTVLGTFKSGRSNNVYLNLTPDDTWKTYGSVAIKSEDLEKFGGNPEVTFKGKKVKITGKIVEEKGNPRIWLSDPSEIEVLGSK